MRLGSICLTLIAFLVAPTAYAVPITSGYVSAVFSRDCALTTCGSTNQPSTMNVVAYSPNGAAPLIGIDHGLLGSGSALAQPTGNIYAPLLRAEVTAGDNSYISSQAIAIQRYTNVGPNPLQVAVNAAIDWTIFNYQPPIGPGLNTGVAYQVAVFETATGFLDIDLTNGITTIVGFGSLFGVPHFIDYFNSTSIATMSGNDVIGSPLLTLGSGDGFFVGVRLLALGIYGMRSDSFNTFTTSFTDESGNVLDGAGSFRPTVVPEPGSLALLGAGLLALGFLRRRRALT